MWKVEIISLKLQGFISRTFVEYIPKIYWRI